MVAGAMLLGAGLAAGAPASAQPRSVPLNPPGARTEFTAYALGVWPIQGHFARFSGALTADPARPGQCAVRLSIDVASLEMADPSRTELAAGPKLLDHARFPTLSYTGICAGSHAAGQITLHGVTRPLALDLHRHGLTVTATGSLRRVDFGVAGLPNLIGQTIRLSVSVPLPDDLAALARS